MHLVKFLIGRIGGWQHMRTKKRTTFKRKISLFKTKYKNSAIVEKILNRKIELRSKQDSTLPSNPKVIEKRVKIFITIILGLSLYWLFLYLINIVYQTKLLVLYHHYVFFSLTSEHKEIPWGLVISKALNVFTLKMRLQYWLELLVVSLGLGYLVARHYRYATKQVAFGQKGDARFTTLSELQRLYKQVPDHIQKGLNPKKASFKGYGGIPISHYKHKYFIDDETVHNIVVGTSRSGKGQTTVIPDIDVISRAEKKSSIIVNDPKGELYDASYKSLKERGYDIYLLNMADGDKGMAYNPLQLIMKAWEQGDVGTALKLVRTLTYTLYHDDKAGPNVWVNEGAQSTVSGMIISLISYCMNPDNFDDHKKHPEKVTLFNIIDMISEMGTVKYAKDPTDPYTKSYVLDEYFNHLNSNSFAKKEYMSTSITSDKSRDNVYSKVIEKLNLFSTPKNARMTSQNTFPLKDVGFPKYISFKFKDPNLKGKKIHLLFKDVEGKLKSKYLLIVNTAGFVEYNFSDDLQTGDSFVLQYILKNQQADGRVAVKRFESHYKIKLVKDKKDAEVIPQKRQQLTLEQVKLHYNDKPIAIFMKIPDSDSSNNALASLFVSQLYTELAKQCDFVAGGKCTRRVQFIFDEFGNMIPIVDMDHIMTVSAGRNMLFTLIIQSYQQLYALYGKEKGQVIKENGQNQILILSTDKATYNEFSEKCGKKTVESSNVNKTMINTAKSVSVSADAVPLILPERLSQMAEGESLVLRNLHRHDRNYRSNRAFPIFNTGKTKMPYAFSFLKDQFDPDTDPNLVESISKHASLDLNKYKVDWSKWITWKDKVVYVNEQTKEEIVKYENLALKAYEEYHQDQQAMSIKSSNTDLGVSAPKLEGDDVDGIDSFLGQLNSNKGMIIQAFLTDHEDIDKETQMQLLNAVKNNKEKGVFISILGEKYPDYAKKLNKHLN